MDPKLPPTKRDVVRLNLGDKAPRCPLCVNNERQHEHFMERKFEPNRGFFIFCCDNYKVAIRVDDPHVGQWEKAQETAGKAPCSVCGADTRYFSTGAGFAMVACPKRSCGATLRTANPKEDREAFGHEETTPDKPGLLQ